MSWFKKLFGQTTSNNQVKAKIPTPTTTSSIPCSEIQQPDCIGVRFDIDKIASGGYGEECWKIFWKAVGTDMVRGAQLLDGDTNDSPDRENVYCIAIKWVDSSGRSNDVRNALEKSEYYLKVASEPKFINSIQVGNESLVMDGKVDQSGHIVGTSYRALPGLEQLLKEPIANDPATIADSACQHSWEGHLCSLCGEIRCPKCSGDVTDVKSLFSKSGSGYGCSKCGWRRRKCVNHNCAGGYLEYVGDLSMYPNSVQFKCVKCDWTGSGVAFHDKDK